MALITCPECQQQVSDQATTCPNCGFPISDHPCNSVDEIQITDSPVVHASSKKKTIIAISSILCVLSLVLTIYFVKKNADERALAEARAEYIANLNDFRITSLGGAAEAESLCNLTYQVWHDTIYKDFNVETYKYSKDEHGFRDDFNDALSALYSDDDTVKKVSSINNNRKNVSEIYKKLCNPSDDLKSCYDVVDAMYSAYHNLTELAVAPSGSLKTYSENFGNYDKAYMELYDKLELLIPEN